MQRSADFASPWTRRFKRLSQSALAAGSVVTALALTGSSVVQAADPAPPFRFMPLASSAACSAGGDPVRPFILPEGLDQLVIASEPDFPDLADMNTENETGPDPGWFLYRTHEVRSNGSVSVTDFRTRTTRILAQRADWERFDGIVWTPWGTLLAAEEVIVPAFPDPAVPQARSGLVYEIDPHTGAAAARPAIGARSHEGLRFDAHGNLYGISETNPTANPPGQPHPGGFIYKFVPDRKGDLSTGLLYALRVTTPGADRTGEAVWVPLPREAVQVDSDAAAAAVGATGYARPEDVETGTSTGRVPGGANLLFVAITGENRVIAIDLLDAGNTAFVFDYVRAGVNAPSDFLAPDNLALDMAGNLYIAEDPGGTFAQGKRIGDDIWVATPSQGARRTAEATLRLASLTDCDAEPTGVYFTFEGDALRVNVQHRGGDGRDLSVVIFSS